jgi:hypothetical protein
MNSIDKDLVSFPHTQPKRLASNIKLQESIKDLFGTNGRMGKHRKKLLYSIRAGANMHSSKIQGRLSNREYRLILKAFDKIAKYHNTVLR